MLIISKTEAKEDFFVEVQPLLVVYCEVTFVWYVMVNPIDGKDASMTYFGNFCLN